jgi:hypothetical protein
MGRDRPVLFGIDVGGPSMTVVALLRPLSAKERWRDEQHAVRYARRYGHRPVLAQGQIITMLGMEFRP